MNPSPTEPGAAAGHDSHRATASDAGSASGGAPAAAAPAIDSRAGWQAAVHWGIAHAIARGARRLVFVDPDFEHWPLDDTLLLQALTGWLRQPQRRLVLLARRYDEVPRRFPRFNAWRRPFAHAIEAWQVAEDSAPELPVLLLDDGALSLQLIDAQRWRGRAALDRRTATLWRERIDAVVQQCEPALAVNTLGL